MYINVTIFEIINKILTKLNYFFHPRKAQTGRKQLRLNC